MKSQHAKSQGFVLFLLVLIALWFCGPVHAQSTAPNFKVAFIGDQGNGSDAQAVLNLIKSEGAQMVLHQGDLDYNNAPDAWDSMITSILGAHFPYFITAGNHDDDNWLRSGGYQDKYRARLARIRDAVCVGNLGVKSTCRYKGLYFVQVAPGLIFTDGGYDTYIWDQLAADNSTWSICSWHVDQTALQVGGKGDEAGWGVYEKCREGGGIVATAHEHSYERTKTLTSMSSQIVDPDWPDRFTLRVAPGSTFAFVSGLGGNSIRNQDRCLPTTYPYGCNDEWAMIYTSDQGAQFGALFIVFNVDNDPNKAHGYFKNVSGQVVDDFVIFAQPAGGPPAPLAVATSSLPDATVGTPYSAQLQAAGGTPPYTWSVSAGLLPAGLSLGSSGAISGTPSADGTFNFTVQVEDSQAMTAIKDLSIVVAPDVTPPETTITINPPTLSNSTSASFSFTSSEPGSTFQCKLDGAAFTSCTSPQTYTGLAGGSHTFQVRATGTAGNTDPTPASYTWTVDTAAPIITGVAAQNVRKSRATIAWATNEASNSQVEYGTTDKYGQATTLDTSLVTNHSQALTRLQSNTTYHYRVSSRDAAGNLAVSSDFIFTTSK